MKKTIRILIMMTLATALLIAGAAFAYAEDGEVALTVQKDGKTVKTFTMEELQQIADDEGNKTYNYSKYNSYANPGLREDVQGPTVNAVLEAADISRSSMSEYEVISFMSSDSYHHDVTTKQLFDEKRYYFPNGLSVDYDEGITDYDREGKEKVPAVIDLNESETCLCIGQTEPGEQNDPVFVKCIAEGGVIDVTGKTAPRCSAVPGVSPKAGTKDLVAKDTEISIKQNRRDIDRYEKIYFTIDGTSPNAASKMYNYDWDELFTCNPVLSDAGIVSVKVIVKAFGMRDSVVQSFSYYVGDALTVKVNGVTKKSYASVDELKNVGDEVTYSYSGFNTYPTLSFKKDRTGIKVYDIIMNATGLIPGVTLKDDAVLTFIAPDSYTTKITAGQLFAKRYYFPNARAGTDLKGGAVKTDAWLENKTVDAIIETGDKYSLLFGQTKPNEQNFAECADDMLLLGQIEIDTKTGPEKCETITDSIPKNGSTIVQGQKIDFPNPYNLSRKVRIISNKKVVGEYSINDNKILVIDTEDGHSNTVKIKDGQVYVETSDCINQECVKSSPISNHNEVIQCTSNKLTVVIVAAIRDKICYSIDGKDSPGIASGFYNYSANRCAENLTNQPVMNNPGTHSIKVKVVGYGKNDSDVTEFKYAVRPSKLASFSVSAKTYNTVTLKWTANAKAKGYEIYRSTGNGYSLLKTITSPSIVSYKDTGLKTGTKYSYRIKATALDENGKTLRSDYVATSATPVLSKPAVTLTAGSKKATVKWKKITGASGYQVYRSVKKTSGFKLVKTVKSGSTVSFVNKNLKKGKGYYFKVKAYRAISGKKVYSSYSTVKYVKVK